MPDNVIPGYMVQNYLPKHQTMRVAGLTSAKSIKMYPNCSDVLLDENDPIVYFCYTDGMGNLKVDAYDITPHKSDEEKQQEQILKALGLINERLTQLEDKINESDATKTATNTESYTESETNQENMGDTQIPGQSSAGFKPNDRGKSKGPRN